MNGKNILSILVMAFALGGCATSAITLLKGAPSHSVLSSKSYRDNIVCLGQGKIGNFGLSRTQNGDVIYWQPDMEIAVKVIPQNGGSQTDLYFGPASWGAGKKGLIEAAEKCK